jgi:hypothetical protein
MGYADPHLINISRRDRAAARPIAAGAFGNDDGLCPLPRSISPNILRRARPQLFDRICELQYYPTRTESASSRQGWRSLRNGAAAEIVEFAPARYAGAPAARCHDRAGAPPADRHLGEHLASAVRGMTTGAGVQPVVRITRALLARRCSARRASGSSPAPPSATSRRRGPFPQVGQVLRGGRCCWARTLSRTRGAARGYNDAQGVTAAFNLNLLARAN